MHKIIFIMLVSLILSFSISVSANENNITPLIENASEICTALKADSKENTKEYVQRGCCSWHGGVCGCTTGRVVCCDGSKSPSCLCNKEQSPEITN